MSSGRFAVTLGEDLEPGSAKGVVSAGMIKQVDSKSIALVFRDNSVRTFSIDETASQLCDREGDQLSVNSFVVGDIVTIRWRIVAFSELKSSDSKEALTVRKGGMRYKYMTADGHMLTPAILDSNGCKAKSK